MDPEVRRDRPSPLKRETEPVQKKEYTYVLISVLNFVVLNAEAIILKIFNDACGVKRSKKKRVNLFCLSNVYSHLAPPPGLIAHFLKSTDSTNSDVFSQEIVKILVNWRVTYLNTYLPMREDVGFRNFRLINVWKEKRNFESFSLT